MFLPAARFEDKFRQRSFQPSIVFHPFSDREYAFREKVFEFSFRPRFRYQVRGIIRFQPEKNTVTVDGYMGRATAIMGVVLIILALLNNYSGTLFVWGIVLLGLPTFLQMRLYTSLGETIRDHYM